MGLALQPQTTQCERDSNFAGTGDAYLYGINAQHRANSGTLAYAGPNQQQVWAEAILSLAPR